MELVCRDGNGRRLYIPEWLEHLGKSRVELAGALGISAPYLSELLSGKKIFVGLHRARDTADFLDLTINDLYTPPPPPEHLETLGKLSQRARNSALAAARTRRR